MARQNQTPADTAMEAEADKRGKAVMRATGTIATTPDRVITVRDDDDYADIQRMVSEYGMAEFPGAQVVDKVQMLGIPFTIVGIRAQRPIRTESSWRDFLTLGIVTGSADEITEQIERKRVLKSVGKTPEFYTDLSELPVKPETRYMINDGSTGVRRQTVTLLDSVGLAVIGGVVEGADQNADRRRFDRSWNLWENATPLDAELGQTWLSSDGEMIPQYLSWPDGRPFLLRCARGLTGSFYINEYAPDGAVTYYVG